MPPASSSAPPPAGRDRRRIAGAVGGALVVAALIALMAIGLANRGIDTGIAEALEAGERPPAPDLALPVLVAADGIGPAGATVSLADLRGRTVVVNIWASWCPPCEKEAPVLDEVARRYRAQGDDVLVLGIDVRDLTDDALRFWREHGLSFPSLRDREDRSAAAFEVAGVPETYVIDPQGRIAFRKIGEVRTPGELVRVIEGLGPA